jgi:hypothetical protein
MTWEMTSVTPLVLMSAEVSAMLLVVMLEWRWAPVKETLSETRSVSK